MKTIGVLGGLGPQATIDFEARWHAAAQRLIPQLANRGYPPMIVYYLRCPPFVMGVDFRPVLPLQPEPQLIEAARRFGSVGRLPGDYRQWSACFSGQDRGGRGTPRVEHHRLDGGRGAAPRWRRVGVIGMGGPHADAIPLGRLGIAVESIPPDLQEQFDRSVIAVYEGAGFGA